MARSVWKGPFVDLSLLKKAQTAQEASRARADQDLVAPLDDPAGFRRPDVQRLQRPQVRAGLGQRGDGRPQAGRVRADALLPRPRRRQEGQALMSKPKSPRKVGEKEALALATSVRGIAAEAEPRRGADPQQAGRRRAQHPAVLDARRWPSTCASASRPRSPMPRTTTISTSTRWSCQEASVGKGLVMKRFATRARGRSARIIKPFSRLRIVVREQEAE